MSASPSTCVRTFGAGIAFLVSLETPWSALAGERIAEVIVTATRHPQELQKFPGSISVVSGDDVQLVGSTHHSESMNRVAGAMIQRNSGEESLTAVRSPVLAGPGSCGAFLFLENSIPIRPVGFCNVNELFEVNTEQASSIEILRGPAGVVYGSGAMHGAINVMQAAPAELPRGSVALDAGPDEYYRGKLWLSHKDKNLDFGAKLLATHDGGWRDSSGVEEQKMNLGLTQRLNEGVLGVNLAATNLDQQSAGFIQGQDAYRDEAIAESNPNPEAYRDAYAMRLTGEYERELSQSVGLTVQPFVRHSRMDFLQHFLIGKPLEENG
ncbi:MAG TPA: TonB-dependent receptor plug domain-containing protein, partial [Steroidobacter sp.]|nr:TonB-dependent receptor plug domain-containing protein [Steroidobacter sp.]